MLSRKIGIDLGTSTVRMYVKGEGVVVNEPALASAADDGARAFHRLIGRAIGRTRLFRPEVMVSVPSTVGSAERRAMSEAVISAGARQVWLIDEPLAAAMGAGLPIAGPRACTVCEIGAATTEIAIISLSGVVVSRSISVGGNTLDASIAAHVERKHGLKLDMRTAERLKIAIGSAIAMAEPLATVVDGVRLCSDDVADAVEQPLRLIVDALRGAVAEAPPELLPDVAERGIVLSGGGAQLRGLDRFISLHAGIPAAVADDPQTTVVRGTGLALERFEVLRRNQSYLR